MSSTRKGSRGSSRDLYTTPEWCIDQLAFRAAELLPVLPQWVVDIGAGDGRIGVKVRQALTKVAPDNQVIHRPRLMLIEPHVENASAIRGRMDEEDLLVPRMYPADADPDHHIRDDYPVLYVSNPPFSQALEIISATLDRMRHRPPGWDAAVFLLPLNWFGSIGRAPFHRGNPPHRLTNLIPRPSFKVVEKIHPKTGKLYKIRTDSNEYAWWWWFSKPYGGTLIEIGERGSGREEARL